MKKERNTFVEKLDNGLTIVGEQTPSSSSAAVGYFVKTGSRDESEVESGISHFLEHMLFKGTPSRSALDISYEMGNLAVKANAFTSEENTVYYGAVLPEYLDPFFELLTDMMRPSLAQEEFDMEKKVILEEIALYQDKPGYYLYEHALAHFYGDNPVGNSVLGTTDSVSAITSDLMRAYIERRYAPSNIVLTVAGNFDWDAFRNKAQQLTASWAPFEAKREYSSSSLAATGSVFKKKDITQTHAMLIAQGPSSQEDLRFPASVVATILGDSSGSRLYWDIVDKGLAEAASIDVDEKDAQGYISFYTVTEPDKIDTVVQIAKDILNQTGDISDQELERAKTKIASRIVLGGELPMGRLMSLGMEWQYREKIHDLDQYVQAVQDVTGADITEALARYPIDAMTEYRLENAA